MTAPDRNAGGLSRAIEKACSMAKRNADEISFVAAHGTATVYSDAMEILAFSNTAGKPKPVFSIKGGIGHTLATAGLLQILVVARAMSAGVVPATVGLVAPDATASEWAHRAPAALGPTPLALSTNSGFSGVNTAILLGLGGQR
jgi:3-oxoacyl-(acyl-carrier-protein) synthase